ncbi:MAG: glycosyltransferase family 2 protein [Bacteroidales bacterium]
MKQSRKAALSVVIPVMNEEKNIPELIQRLRTSAEEITTDYELIFVNDGSRDATLAAIQSFALQDPRIRYISFSRNFGHQIAVSAGLDHAFGDAVVIIDGDLQDPPELIPKLYAKYLEGYQVVYARRSERKGETIFKKITAKWFYRTLNRITEIEIPLDTGDFRLIDKKIADHLRGMPEPNKFLRGQIAWLGYRQTFVEFSRDPRKAGKTGYPLKKMLRFALDGITGFSNAPLRFVTNAGIIVSILAFLIILYALYSHLILHQTISGWTSLIISMMFIGGIQLIAIGIIGEYISRINTSVRNRPLYIIEDSNIQEDN